MRIAGRRYDTAEAVVVECTDGAITQILPLLHRSPEQEPPVLWIAPGLVDLQVNGHHSQDLTDPELTPEWVTKISLGLDAYGVTGFLPTVVTHDYPVLAHSLSTINQACATVPEVARRVLGIHLEGPYISAEDGPRGAHPRAHCRPPDWDEFQRLQQAAEGRIRILTLSPEYEGSAAFVARVTSTGVVVAIGHTAANSDQITSCVDAGARLSTHLGNGAHARLDRHPNYLWDQLAEDRLVASLIVDGHHLPPSVVRSFVRSKTPARCILVSDMTGIAGMPAGHYKTSLGAVDVLEDGRVVIAGQTKLLAGASLPLNTGIEKVMDYAGVDLCTALNMASRWPADLIHSPTGRLEIGAPANLIKFDFQDSVDDQPPRFQIRAVINHGELAWGPFENSE